MSVNVGINTSFILHTLVAVICILITIRVLEAAARLLWRRAVRGGKIELLRSIVAEASPVKKDAAAPTPPEELRENAQDAEMRLYKRLYVQLHRLEQHPEILPQARDLLISMFSETLAAASKEPPSGILTVEHYTPENLAGYLRSEHDKISHEWEQYLARRKAGWPRDMFRDREEAKRWLKQIAPVKYVDGAWLGHINKTTTPFALRRTTKDAWQVLSEELGDGDLEKNHVRVYHKLMEEIGAGLPEEDAADFVHPRHGLDEVHVWKAAVAQLLISLFPNEFLPEILGFNMHFEAVTMETLKAAKELKELRLNAYYFILHVSIDNADSGHTAIAMETVNRYIEHIQRQNGSFAAQQAWKRIQVGYILSERLPQAPDHSPLKEPVLAPFPRTRDEAEVIRIFKAKAAVAHKIHCSSNLKIGRRTLVDWLEPNAFSSKQWQMEFMDDLSNMKPWIRKGDSRKSKLMRELAWEGKMFGSFTQTEVDVLKRWIDSMGDPDPGLYWSFVGRTETTSKEALQSQDITLDYPVFSKVLLDKAQTRPMSSTNSPLLTLGSAIKITATADMTKFLPLWFTHPCLLESFISVPLRTMTKSSCAIIRLLRAQYGFGVEGPGVAGMDEVRRTENFGIVELGLEMMRRSGFPEPECLKEVLTNRQSEFATTMLHLSMRPIENASLLLGLARAFVGLHEAMVSSSTVLLSAASREVLGQMACRERESLTICLEELKGEESRYEAFCQGHDLGKREIESCFGESRF